MARPLRASVYGAGQAGTSVADLLRRRGGVDVLGPFGRDRREEALRSGADVVVIATASFLGSIADDLRDAVEAGSNVITTAEEAAYPWANDPDVASRIDALARRRGVSVLGAGLNPGFVFDALVLTACGAAWDVDALHVKRVVDLSGFSENVLRRIGVGHSPEAFVSGIRDGAITGHIGFPQSMGVVAARMGVEIERIGRSLEPLVTDHDIAASHLTVLAGETAGFEQRYTAIAEGKPWFEALFTGHVSLAEVGLEPLDQIRIDGETPLRLSVEPGINPQVGSSAVIANSVTRVAAAAPGWITVADLPPAVPG